MNWLRYWAWRLLYPDSFRDYEQACKDLDDNVAYMERTWAKAKTKGLMPDPEEVMRRHPEIDWSNYDDR